jgi:hypothetical protein
MAPLLRKNARRAPVEPIGPSYVSRIINSSAMKVRAAEIYSAQIHAMTKMSAAQVPLVEVGTTEVYIPQTSVAKVDAAEICTV